MRDRGYECVDPDVGEGIWRLDDPDLDADDRPLLEAHLAVCDACRLRRETARRVAGGLRSGALRLPRAGRVRSWPLSLGGGALVAASLVLALVLPPRPRHADDGARGGEGLRFLRPVEGEVVSADDLQLRWEGVAGASGYRVALERVGDPWRWRVETGGSAVSLPDSVTPLPDGDFRARVQPVPADLAPLGGATVSFRTGGLIARLRHRLVAMPTPALFGGIAGLVLLGAAIVRSRRAGPRPAAA